MTGLTPLLSALLPSFLASLVEMVEAFTIVLAVGLTQGWRPALAGTVLGLIALGVLVLVLAPVLDLVPLELLQFIIGALLILFGLRWLRKAILRAAGHLPLRDERIAFAKETDALRRHAHSQRASYLAGLAAFNAVLLEGLEVVFIVLAVGLGHGLIAYASLGAAAAFVVVLIIGIAVHRPLAKVPENGLKFVVGLMLTSFGVFWTGEGLGVDWPGADLSLLGILLVFAAVSIGAVVYLRPSRKAQLRVVK
ncbi:MAG TPA: hypothetical protein VL418_15810 [Devosiaceae bacterium]|nr:hypothetical protein [Devosiaceae bacterium]